MKLYIAALIVAMSVVTVVPEASAICASADPEINGPIVTVETDPIQVGINEDPIDTNAYVKWGDC